MIEVAQNLLVGSKEELPVSDNGSMAYVHACQTVHYAKLGWDWKYNKPSPEHPNYRSLRQDNHMFLNWVDGAAKYFRVETFIEAMDFVDAWIGPQKVFIHCDRGESRAPSLALVWLSKRLRLEGWDTFESAERELIKIYPLYRPGEIREFVMTNWTALN